MKVIIADKQQINLEQSPLNPNHSVSGQVITTGALVLNSKFQLYPLVSDFLSSQLIHNKISDTTAKTYGANIGYFLQHLECHYSFKGFKLDEGLIHVQKHNIEEYNTDLKNMQGLSSKTIRNRDAALMSFISGYLCQGQGNKKALRADDPYEDGLLAPPAKDNLIQACEIEELISLISMTNSERERCLLQFMFDSGVRRSEVSRISKSSIDKALESDNKNKFLGEDIVYLPSGYTNLLINGAKGRNRQYKPRETIVSRATLQRIRKYHSSPLYKKYVKRFGSNPPAFFNAHGGGYTKSSVAKLINRVAKRALGNRLITKLITPHMLRHGFAYLVLGSEDLGKDYLERLVILQKSMGHEFLSTTEVYTRIPHEIYGRYKNLAGKQVYRKDLMEHIVNETRLKIVIGDKK
jgi:integrase/recombinase XerD